MTPDPANWPEVITSTFISDCVKSGPYQHATKIFPVGKNGRCFTLQHFHRTLIMSNKEESKRDWMMYSDKNDAVYCFPCKLFGCSSSGLSTSAIASTGFTDWKNMSCTLKTHECSERHFDCILKWKELRCRLQMNATISQAQLDEVQAERRKWRLILERMIAIPLSLAERNLAFRGHHEKLWEHGNGNFLKEAELLAKFDPVMESHLTHVSTSPSRCIHYMSLKRHTK